MIFAADVLEFDVAVHLFELDRVRRARHVNGRIQHFHDPLRRGGRPRRHRHQEAALSHRTDDLQEIGVKRDELAQCQLVADDQQSAHPQHDHGRCVGDEVQQWRVE